MTEVVIPRLFRKLQLLLIPRDWTAFVDPTTKPPRVRMRRRVKDQIEVREATAEEEADYLRSEAW